MENLNPETLHISLEFTPNPNTLKYTVNRVIVPFGGASFRRTQGLDTIRSRSLLAANLFEIDGLEAVLIGKDFVTVSKTEEGDWDSVHSQTMTSLQEFLNSGARVLEEDFLEDRTNTGTSVGNSEVEKKIIDILEQEIRPAVAMDGGDIHFERFENGTVFLHMKGSCAGCPSATATLKQGIETRLKERVPEVQEVVSL